MDKRSYHKWTKKEEQEILNVLIHIKKLHELSKKYGVTMNAMGNKMKLIRKQYKHLLNES